MVAMINTALMRTIMAGSRLRQRFSEERGQDLLEYAMLGGFLAAGLVVLGAILVDGGAFTSMACGIGDAINMNNVPLAGCP